ncbi:MAG TPA: hypothetical protein VK254_01025 [Candidatus Bathyarchaeia archaeon]|nr:hypothetical protein [Candidatus Bathyarchaeia archaeon]
MKKNIYKNQQGQIIVIGLVFFAILLIFSTAILVGVSNYIRSERLNISKVQALHLAEAGIDKAAYELNQNSNYMGESNTALGNGTVTISVSSIDAERKRVTSEGAAVYGGKTTKSTIKAILAINNNVISFRYGIQAGNGGFTLANTSSITGNAFSTGPIIGSGSNYIHGDIISAGPSGWVYGVHATGNVFSHTIGKSGTGTSVDKDAYYVTKTNTTVTGASHPNSPDQAPAPLPISDAQISQWETDAAAEGTISTCDAEGNYNIPDSMSLGPKKIACNLVIKNIAELKITGPIWVTGNITTKSSTIKMDPNLGSANVAIIADNPSNMSGSGIIDIQTSTDFQGSGSAGSFVFMISQNNSAETGGSTAAISQGQSATALVAYASHGLVNFSNSANVKEATAYKISLQNTANVTYDSGLPSTLFESGPGASWTFTPGSYTIEH